MTGNKVKGHLETIRDDDGNDDADDDVRWEPRVREIK